MALEAVTCTTSGARPASGGRKPQVRDNFGILTRRLCRLRRELDCLGGSKSSGGETERPLRHLAGYGGRSRRRSSLAMIVGVNHGGPRGGDLDRE